MFFYLVPLYGLVKTAAHLFPPAYYRYAIAPTSPHNRVVREAVERALNAEYGNSKSQYHKQIKEWMGEKGVMTIGALSQSLLRVVSIDSGIEIHSTGTEIDLGNQKGQYYVGISPKASQELIDALPWFATHELHHILNGDWVEISAVKTVTSFVVAFFTSYFCEWEVPAVIGSSLLSNIVVHALMSNQRERAADRFANKYCDPIEQGKAKVVFKNKAREASAAQRLFARLTHPSPEERIAAIEYAMV